MLQHIYVSFLTKDPFQALFPVPLIAISFCRYFRHCYPGVIYISHLEFSAFSQNKIVAYFHHLVLAIHIWGNCSATTALQGHCWSTREDLYKWNQTFLVFILLASYYSTVKHLKNIPAGFTLATLCRGRVTELFGRGCRELPKSTKGHRERLVLNPFFLKI